MDFASIMSIILCVGYGVLVILLGAGTVKLKNQWWLAVLLALVAVIVATVLFTWLFIPWTAGIFLLAFAAAKAPKKGVKAVFGILAVVVVILGTIILAPKVNDAAIEFVGTHTMTEDLPTDTIVWPPALEFTETEAAATEVAPTEVAMTEAPAAIPAATNTPTIPEAAPADACKMATNLNLRNGGYVDNNIDNGDYSDWTINLFTKDDPSTEPVLIITAPQSSVDIEYPGKIFHTGDRAKGSLQEVICLAESLHPSIKNKIYIGPETLSKEATQSGWKVLNDVDGWWTSSTWLFQEAPIQPDGLTCSKPYSVSPTQKDRTLTAKENEKIFGEFWNPNKPGFIIPFQVQEGMSLDIPIGMQGTYWIWTGDFKRGEIGLQKRMLQAIFQEVVYRDQITVKIKGDIKTVTLLSCGALPDLDSSLLSFKVGDTTIAWQTSLEGWKCEVTK